MFPILLVSDQPCPVFPSSILDFSNRSQANTEGSHVYSKLGEIYHSPKSPPSPPLFSHHLPCCPLSFSFFNLLWSSARAEGPRYLSLYSTEMPTTPANQWQTLPWCSHSCCPWEHRADCHHEKLLNFPFSKLTLKILLCHDALKKKLSMVKQLVCRDHCLLCQSISSYF